MKAELFNELVASVREGGKVMRGEAKPSRIFIIKKHKVKKIHSKDKHSRRLV